MTRNRQPHHHSGPLSSSYSCFRPLPSDDNKTHHSSPPPTPTPPPPPLAATANLTTSLYHTRIGMFAVTWSRNFLGRSLRIHLLHHDNNNNNNNNKNNSNNNNNSNKNNNNNNSNKNNNNNNRRRQTHRSLSLPSSPCVTNSPYSSSSSSSFHLTLKPYLFWNKQGSRKLLIPSIGNATVYWDLTRAKFGSGAPDPDSGFYIAVVIPGGEIALLLGDLDRQAQLRAQARSFKSSSSKSSLPPPGAGQALVVRREHVQQGARKLHRTRAQFGGKSREISIECDDDDRPDPSLVIRVDSTPAVQLKHLRWKFRGSERVEIDGHPLQISWDAHDWLFDAESSNQNSKDGGGGGGGGGFALFTFRFEKRAEECCFGEDYEEGVSTTSSSWTEDELITGVENKEMGKRKRRSLAARKARSCSSSSLSSSAASSSACGSVLEWESVEESDLKGGPTAAFSLVVYAWKS